MTFTMGAMVSAVLKLYFIGTALSVLAALYGMGDSFGGLMYVQDHQYMLELEHQTTTPLAGLLKQPSVGIAYD